MDRQALTYVELDVGVCSLVYGEAPCTATLEGENPTGTFKCHNTLGTCQDRDNYTETERTVRFTKPSTYLPADIEALPYIVNVTLNPAILAPGESIGTRASLTIEFKDHPHSDTGGFDPYRAERAYDPYRQGSFFGKWRSRWPFLKGEPVRLIQGFVGQSLEDMETRHFIVDSFDGPSPEGTFTITAKDPLRMIDGGKTNAPAPSQGFLQAQIDASETTATLSPTGIGDEEYPVAGYLNIGGKEIVAFTRSGDTLTLTRAQWNTEGVEHDAGERCQLCLHYDGEDPADIIRDLLVTYGLIDPDWCNLTAWQAETDAFLRRLYTGFIAEPTSVNALVSELIEQAGLTVWWDDLAQQVRLQVLRAIPTDSVVYGETLFRKKTFQVKDQPASRVSQVWVSYAQNNPLKSLEDKDNYRQVEIVADLQNEADYGQRAVHKIWSRWIPFGGGSTARRAGDLRMGRFLTPPRRFNFSLWRGAQADPQLGDGCLVEHRVLQDATGAMERVPAQIVSVRATEEGWDIEALEMRFVSVDDQDLDVHSIVLSGVATNVNLQAVHDQLYPVAEDGDLVAVTISPGAVIGSTSTSTYALMTGEFVAGVTLTLVNGGTVAGRGGAGGRGAYKGTPNRVNAQNGFPGGPGLLIEHACDLTNNGIIAGGAGGGGGAGCLNLDQHTAGPGGGGAGFEAGAPGPNDKAGRNGTNKPKAGKSGTLMLGGDGGQSFGSFSFFVAPRYTNVYGGRGGHLGQSGVAGGHHGGNSSETQRGSGGAPGTAIQGFSLANVIVSGDVRGPTAG